MDVLGLSGSGRASSSYLLLDVFSAVPLKGNQLAVFPDGRDVVASAMQAIACELRLSETVFLMPPEAGGDARARIFTPAAELPFAGHPLLGAAIVLALARRHSGTVVIETGAGPVEVAVSAGEDRVHAGEMRRPAPSGAPFAAAAELLAALGVERSELPVEEYRNGPRHVFVTVGSEGSVASLAPDMRALRALGDDLAISCFAGSGKSYKTRMFSPALGVEEDPATGSAAGALIVHCVRHGLVGAGERIEIRQGEEIGRPSLLRACAEGPGGTIDTVRVGGDVVAVGRGEIYL